jgi:hypothetical protein
MVHNSGCPGSSTCPTSSDQGAARTVEVKGRVVDFETCLTTVGCQGAPNVRVALFFNSAIYSAPTTGSGAFTLSGVPDGARLYLLVTDASGGASYLSTLQAEPVDTKGKDLFGIELYTLKREGGLFAGVASEASLDLQTSALYLGQVLSIQGGKMKAIPDVTVHSVPAGDVRYVNCIPTFQQCAGQPTLFQSRSSTGVFGEFVLISKAGEHVVWGTSTQQSFTPVTAPVGVGYLTIGLHRAQGSAPPQPDATAPPPDDGGP